MIMKMEADREKWHVLSRIGNRKLRCAAWTGTGRVTTAASLYTKPWVRSGKEWRGGWRPGTECPLYRGRTAAGWTNCSWTWIKTSMSKYLRSFKWLNQRLMAFISCTRHWQSSIHLISVYRQFQFSKHKCTMKPSACVLRRSCNLYLLLCKRFCGHFAIICRQLEEI